MIENPTFIILEGWLSEAGEFQLRRGYEDTHAEIDIRFGSNTRNIIVALVDEDGQILASVLPTISFPSGCTPKQVGPGVGLLRAAIPLNRKAHRIELTSNGYPIYTAKIGSEVPSLNEAAVSVDDTIAWIVFDAGNEQLEVQLLAQLSDGRRLRPSVEREGNEFRVDLHTLEGLGEATFVIEATAAFRTTRATTQPVALPPATVKGWIIEPAPGSEWPFGWRGSLIGSVFDRNGRRLDWCQEQVFWLVDGKPIDDRRQLVPWRAEKAGEYRFQLAYDVGDGQFYILDETKVVVRPQTPEQKAYAAFMATREV